MLSQKKSRTPVGHYHTDFIQLVAVGLKDGMGYALKKYFHYKKAFVLQRVKVKVLVGKGAG